MDWTEWKVAEFLMNQTICHTFFRSRTGEWNESMIQLLIRALLHLAFVVYLQKSLNSKSLKKVELLVRCLVVICRNFDNIPLIASCDFVKESVGITATIVHQVCTPQSGHILHAMVLGFSLSSCILSNYMNCRPFWETDSCLSVKESPTFYVTWTTVTRAWCWCLSWATCV